MLSFTQQVEYKYTQLNVLSLDNAKFWVNESESNLRKHESK